MEALHLPQLVVIWYSAVKRTSSGPFHLLPGTASLELPSGHFVGITAIELELANFEIVITKRTINSYPPGQIIATSS